MSLVTSLAVMLCALYVMAEIVDQHFVKSLDRISAWLGLPPSVAGATLLAFGTSAPEISTALVALFAEGAHPGTGVGSIVGSAIFQVLVVIGFSAMVQRAHLNWRPILRDSLCYAVSIALLILFIDDGRLTLAEGATLVGCYLLYLGLMAWWVRNVDEAEPEPPPPPAQSPGPWSRFHRAIMTPARVALGVIPDVDHHPRWTVPVFALSLAGVGYACFWLVLAAEAFATHVGVSATVIALTILAGGTSLPEVLASAVISRQGRGDMAIANAIGSNIFDILVSLGLPVLLYCAMHGDLTAIDEANIGSSVVLLFTTLIVVVVLMAIQRFRIGRPFGAFLVLLYAVYVWAAYQGHIDRIHL